MKAYKCDRCGKFYEDYISRKSKEIYNITRNPNITGCCLDLCKGCSDELQEWVDAFTKVKAESEDLPSATSQKWIPVSERLPKVNGKYLVIETTTVNGLIGEYIEVEMYANDLYKIDEFDFSDKQGVASWYNFDGEYGYYEVDNVIAWMPLPEPYKAESEDKE